MAKRYRFGLVGSKLVFATAEVEADDDRAALAKLRALDLASLDWEEAQGAATINIFVSQSSVAAEGAEAHVNAQITDLPGEPATMDRGPA